MPFFNRSSASLHYDLTGNGRQLLILSHELGGSLDSWDGVVAALKDSFLILRWDQRGAGLSEKVVENCPMETHADDLENLIEHLGLAPPFCIAGVAAGCAPAMVFAQMHSKAIKAAVFCSPALGVDPDRREYLRARSERAAIFGMRAIVDATLERSYPPESIADRTIFEDYRSRFLGNDPRSYAIANSALADFHLGTLLSDISYPVAFLAGRYDRLRPPAYVENLAGQVEGASYEVIDSGHIMPVQAADQVADAILKHCSLQREARWRLK